MGIKSIWLHNDIDEDKLKKIAKKEDKSVSNFLNKILKESDYDILKEKK